jgi:PAS domain S-box-containing protein
MDMMDHYRSLENYRLLAENSADLIVRISIDGKCLYVSPACVDLLGFQAAELIGRNAFDFIHPLDRRIVANAIEPEIMLGTHDKIIFRLKKKNGYYAWFEGKFQFFGDLETKELQIVAVARDVSDRIRTERFDTLRHSITAMKASATNLDSEFAFLLKTICETLMWDAGEIWLVDETNMVLRRRAYWCGASATLKKFGASSAKMAFAPGVGLPGMVWSREEVSLMDDLSTSYASLRRVEYDKAGFKSAIGAPLLGDSRINGVVLFLSRKPIQRNKELLAMIAEAGQELGDFIAKFLARESFLAESKKLGVMVEEGTERIRTLQSELLRQQKLEQDILLAAEVQRNLLPTKNPVLPGFEISSSAIPARYISGDFFDYAMSGPLACDIIIADVSGKGIPAAMMTSAARMIFKVAVDAQKKPSETLREMNRLLYEDLERNEMFLTAQCIKLNLDTGGIAYASAGHTEALHFRPSTGECVRLPSTALPVGILKDMSVDEIQIRTVPGDYFVIYSDGVTEAVDDKGELFGIERFENLLREEQDASAGSLVNALLAEIRGFSGDEPMADDLTLIVLKATPREFRYETAPLMKNLDPAVAYVRAAALPYGAGFADEMELVASELITNVITHSASQNMELRLRQEADRVLFDLQYPGESFDPEAGGMELPDPLEEGGRGIHIVRALVDELQYSYQIVSAGPGSPGLNHWHFVKSAKWGTSR